MRKYTKIGFLIFALFAVITLFTLSTNVFSQAWSTFHDGNTLIKGQLRVLDKLVVSGSTTLTGATTHTGATTNTGAVTNNGAVTFNSTVGPALGIFESFSTGTETGFMTLQLDGTTEDGTANVHNTIYLGNGHKINYVPIVGQTATIAMTANGLNIGLDQNADDGAELYVGVNGASGHGAIIGTTPAFKASLTFQIADVSGTDDFHFGFRRAETVNGTFDNYLDAASIGFVTSANPAAIQLETILNNAGTTTTDTTDTVADGTSIKFTVLVSAAGAVTYLIDGVAPSTTAAFTFDDGDLVIPFIHYLQHTDLTEDFDLEEFEYALQ